MKNKLLFLFAIICSLLSFAQKGKIRINQQTFEFKKDSVENENGPKMSILKIYKGKNKVLEHILYKNEVDCNSTSLQVGNYKISGNEIIFYTYWLKMGDAPASPFGVYKQIFSMDSKGKMIPKRGKIYIEETNKGWNENKNADFLYKAPKSASEKLKFKKYIADLEKQYHADFVLGEQKSQLMKEVKKAVNASKYYFSQEECKNALGGCKQ